MLELILVPYKRINSGYGNMKKTDLNTSIGALKLKNPVLVASGTFGYGGEFKDIVRTNDLGGIITKTITLHPRDGNPPPRLFETPSGLLNSIGLQNVGVDVFLKKKLPALRAINVPIIASIAGETIDEFKDLACLCSRHERIAGLELNLSCPNLNNEGKVFGEDQKTVGEVVSAVRQVFKRPILAKLSPVAADIVACARASALSGADGVTIANTYPGMSIDVLNKKPRLGNITGGLSGPAIRPLTMRLVWMVARHVDIPIVASGGVGSVSDALEYLMAGARAVSIGTALYIDPSLPGKVIAGLSQYVKKNKMKNIQPLIGSVQCKK